MEDTLYYQNLYERSDLTITGILIYIYDEGLFTIYLI